MESYFITTALGTLALVAMVIAVSNTIVLIWPRGRAWLRATFGGNERHVIGWAWVVASTAMAGSLYLSDVLHLPPCQLCWYQRIAMYPLVLVLGVGVFRGDMGVWRYALPLPLVGGVISVYHVLLQHQPSLEIVACTVGTPCTARLLVVHGFVSIPVMAAAAFFLIAAFLMTVRFLEANVRESAV